MSAVRPFLPSGPNIGRRRFVQGLAAAGALACVGTPVRRSLAASPKAVLNGTRFDLDIAPMPVNITGRPRTATAINGLLPGPVLHWLEDDEVTLAVTNRLDETSSIHWHGIRTPSNMDGVPGMSFRGIDPGMTFTYRFRVPQHGTYWYHSHSGLQEQTGVYGAIVIAPKDGYAQPFDRDYVVLLSDWTDEDPEAIVSNLKFQSDYYNFGQRTAGTFFADVSKQGLAMTVADRMEWGKMRMTPTDILDVNGSTYTYLVNGQPPAANWTALFKPGERVRLRFVNASAMSIFDVRIPGLAMTVVAADGNDVEPVTVDEFRIGTAETYDVIVTPPDRAFAIFAQAQDRSGFALATLAPRPDMAAAAPAMDPRPMRTMTDMGMDHGAMGGMGGMDHGAMPGMDHGAMRGMAGMHHGAMPGMDHGAMAGGAPPLEAGVQVDNVATMPKDRLAEPGGGLEGNGRRVLTYKDLRALRPGDDPRPPSREITLHLSGNMQRFIWGFDGKKFMEAEPIVLQHGERVRFVLINDTMMDHPIHLHGLWSELENGQDEYRPYKHTVLVKPGERVSYLVSADERGRWAYHCHLLYHMETGMMREVRVV